MTYPNLPLLVAKDKEQQKSWDGIATPHDLATYLATMLSVDPSKLLQLNEIIYSDIQPTGDDAKKLWIKTEEPVGVGIPSGDGYNVIYKYPINVPFLYIGEKGDIPSQCRIVTDSELESYSITKPISSTAIWVIVEA